MTTVLVVRRFVVAASDFSLAHVSQFAGLWVVRSGSSFFIYVLSTWCTIIHATTGKWLVVCSGIYGRAKEEEERVFFSLVLVYVVFLAVRGNNRIQCQHL